MFRILFTPKETPNKNEIHVLDTSYGKFNSFLIDTETNELKVWIQPNGPMTFEELEERLKERWDIRNVEYRIEDSIVHIKIPENHEVMIQI
jgi:hypothetical protein